MELFIGEHGEALVYGIIGTFIVLTICTICFGKWRQISPTYKTSVEGSNGNYMVKSEGKYPKIESDEIIYADYKNDKFNYRDFIRAKDWDGSDITKNMNIYGEVNVFQKGIYKLRCVVVSENQLSCTKYINVIVE